MGQGYWGRLSVLTHDLDSKLVWAGSFELGVFLFSELVGAIASEQHEVFRSPRGQVTQGL